MTKIDRTKDVMLIQGRRLYNNVLLALNGLDPTDRTTKLPAFDDLEDIHVEAYRTAAVNIIADLATIFDLDADVVMAKLAGAAETPVTRTAARGNGGVTHANT